MELSTTKMRVWIQDMEKITVSDNTIFTLSGFDALKNEYKNQKMFVWQNYCFKPTTILMEKLLIYSLISIFIDGLSNSGYDEISSENLSKNYVQLWKKMPDEFKFFNSKVDSRYLTVMSDLEYYFRCKTKDSKKWYFIVKRFMRDLEYHLENLSEDELKKQIRKIF